MPLAWFSLALLSCDTIFDIVPPKIKIIEPKEDTTYFNTLPVELTVTDNGKITKVEVFLDDASVHEFTREPYMTEIDLGGISASILKVVAYDRAGNWKEAERLISLSDETVSKPNTPSGPNSGNTNTSYTYSSGGASSSLGHSLQYRFYWEPGDTSSWSSSTSASHPWSSAGNYSVKAQARCATHTSVESAWSSEKSVTVQVWEPVLVGSYDTPGNAFGVYVTGGYAYVTDNSGLQVINISNPASPALTGSYDTPGNARGVYVTGGYAYVTDNSGLQVIDVSNPASPALTGSVDTPGNAFGVYVTGGYAYVTDNSGLQVIDVSNPANPELAGSHDMTSQALGVFVAGGYAYVTDNSGLQVIDVSNPANPTLAGSVDTPGLAVGVYVAGGYAYVADYDSGLQVVDVSNPANPTLAGSVDTPGLAVGVYVAGGYAYVADRQNGLKVIDVSNPANPVLAGSVDTPGNVFDVYVTGGYAYVIDTESGLLIFDVSGLP